MGRLRDLILGVPPEMSAQLIKQPRRTPVFSVNIDPGVLYGAQSIDEAMQASPFKLSRREAIRVPAVKRARDLIAGSLGALPLRMYDQDNRPVDWSLFDQPEAGTARSVTWTNVVDDLLFHGVAWLRVTHVGWHGKPAEVVRLDPATVTVQPDTRVYHSRSGNGVAWEWLPDDQLIRIDSPHDPLLVAGARAIRALTRLEQAALRYADGAPPLDYFTPADGVDPDDDELITDFLDDWRTARQTRATAYVPAWAEYHSNTVNPEQLQLAQAREFAITEIARLTGIDAEELSTPTTSRTYFNAQDRRRAFLDFTLGPFLVAIQDRLSMDDVTPRGYRARFDTAEFVRADDATTAQTDAVLISAGVMTRNEVRARRGLEPLDEAEPAPAPAPQEATADAL